MYKITLGSDNVTSMHLRLYIVATCALHIHSTKNHGCDINFFPNRTDSLLFVFYPLFFVVKFYSDDNETVEKKAMKKTLRWDHFPS